MRPALTGAGEGEDMSKKQIWGLVIAVGAAVVLGAGSVSIGAGVQQTETFTVEPSKLAKDKFSNVRFSNTLSTPNDPLTGQPPTQTRSVLDYSKNFRFNNDDWPACKATLDELATAPDADAAKQLCGSKSIVSDDSASKAEVVVGGAPPPFDLIEADVVAFNAPKGKGTMFYGKSTGHAASIPPVVFMGKLRDSKLGGKFGQALDVAIPPLTVGATSLFQLTIAKSVYVQARCKPKQLTIRATTTYADGSKSVAEDSMPCTVKKK